MSCALGKCVGDIERDIWPVGHVDLDPLPLHELGGLYDVLTAEERRELLEGLLIAASIGWRQVPAVLGSWILGHQTQPAVDHLLEAGDHLSGEGQMNVALAAALHAFAAGLPRHDYLTPPALLPSDGIYFFFETGETVSLSGETVDRIVRVGTHRVDGRFRQRIRQHYGNVGSLGGNKNGSVFRRHLGGALLRQKDPNDHRLGEWVMQGGGSYAEVEAEVSRTLRERFTFCAIPAADSTERLASVQSLPAIACYTS